MRRLKSASEAAASGLPVDVSVFSGEQASRKAVETKSVAHS